LQAIITLFLGSKRALWVPVIYILVKLTSTFLQTLGVSPNPHMENTVIAKASAQLPNEHGIYGPLPADQSVTVFLVGARSNHPLGPLAQGYKKMGDFFAGMCRDLSTAEAADKYGLIGITPWIGAERGSNNGPMTVMYFKSEKGVHDFAHDPLHAEAWTWMASHSRQYPYLGFWHESFTAEKGRWEAIYANDAPLGLGAGAVRVTEKSESGEGKGWAGTLVDASRGVLRSSRGRMRDTSGVGDKVAMETRVYAS